MNEASHASTRRRVLKAAAGVATISALPFPNLLRAQSQPLKIGIILPLTGPIAAPGTASKRGMDLAFKMYAEQGVRMEPQYADFESKAENGRLAAEKLLRDGKG